MFNKAHWVPADVTSPFSNHRPKRHLLQPKLWQAQLYGHHIACHAAAAEAGFQWWTCLLRIKLSVYWGLQGLERISRRGRQWKLDFVSGKVPSSLLPGPLRVSGNAPGLTASHQYVKTSDVIRKAPAHFRRLWLLNQRFRFYRETCSSTKAHPRRIS